MKTLIRMQKQPGGGEKAIRIGICKCVGKATRTHIGFIAGMMGWSAGRRGPEGGICGACGGAIPSAEEEKRLEEQR